MNRIYFKITFVVFIVMFFALFSFATKAQEQQTPENFIEYIYANYADENFKEVYANFADELKELVTEKEYIEFQKKNFDKYSLEYSEINVDHLQQLSYEEFEDEFSFLETDGEFYSLEVSYLLKFKRFGDREEKTEKKVYLRQNSSDVTDKKYNKFQLFWDPEPILKNEDSESVD